MCCNTAADCKTYQVACVLAAGRSGAKTLNTSGAVLSFSSVVGGSEVIWGCCWGMSGGGNLWWWRECEDRIYRRDGCREGLMSESEGMRPDNAETRTDFRWAPEKRRGTQVHFVWCASVWQWICRNVFYWLSKLQRKAEEEPPPNSTKWRETGIDFIPLCVVLLLFFYNPSYHISVFQLQLPVFSSCCVKSNGL